MLRLVNLDKRPISEAAKACGFSRPSFYQAQAAFEQGGLAGLIPRKPGPHGGHKLTPAVLQFVTEARATDPSVRADRLAQWVRQRFSVRVHPRSIERQLADIDRLTASLRTDDAIIALRERIEQETRRRYDEAVVTAAEYVDRRNDVLAARLTRVGHDVELAQARARYLTTIGLELR